MQTPCLLSPFTEPYWPLPWRCLTLWILKPRESCQNHPGALPLPSLRRTLVASLSLIPSTVLCSLYFILLFWPFIEFSPVCIWTFLALHTHLHTLFHLVWVCAVCVHAKLFQSCPAFCNCMDYYHQAPLSMGFSRQEYWSGLPLPSPGDLPDLGTDRSLILWAVPLP